MCLLSIAVELLEGILGVGRSVPIVRTGNLHNRIILDVFLETG